MELQKQSAPLNPDDQSRRRLELEEVQDNPIGQILLLSRSKGATQNYLTSGTGTLIKNFGNGRYLMLTCQHLLFPFKDGCPLEIVKTQFLFQRHGKSQLSGLFELDLKTFKALDGYSGDVPCKQGLDFATCEVIYFKGNSQGFHFLELASTAFDDIQDQDVAVSGYPR